MTVSKMLQPESLVVSKLLNTLTVSDENTRHKMGLPGRYCIVSLAWISIRPWLVNAL